jgi:hypothetical protein
MSKIDLLVKGDRIPRRVKAYRQQDSKDIINFNPGEVFRLVPGAYNKLSVEYRALSSGDRYLIME